MREKNDRNGSFAVLKAVSHVFVILICFEFRASDFEFSGLAGAVIFPQQLTQAIMREGGDVVIVAPSHVMISDERIDDGFFDRFHCRSKYRIEPVVGHGLDCMGGLVRIGRARIGGGKRDEEVAGTVARGTAGPGKSQRGAAREAFELVR
jgi:hypothetical protein